jgi:hypothetical protein
MALAAVGVLVVVLAVVMQVPTSETMPGWMRILIPLLFVACSALRFNGLRARWLALAAASGLLLNNAWAPAIALRILIALAGGVVFVVGLKERKTTSDLKSLAVGAALVLAAFLVIYFVDL